MDKEANAEEMEVFGKISANDVNGLQNLLANLKLNSVDFVDESGMTPLQHACYKGNKEIAQIILDQVCEPKVLRYHLICAYVVVNTSLVHATVILSIMQEPVWVYHPTPPLQFLHVFFPPSFSGC